MMTNQEVRTWLESAPNIGVAHFYPGPDLPDDPNRFVIVTATGGAGFDIELAIDRPAFQLRVAGEQNDYDDAEQLAKALDKFIVKGPYPATVAGKRITSAQRFGSEPAPLISDDADRNHFVCTYIIQQPSDIDS